MPRTPFPAPSPSPSSSLACYIVAAYFGDIAPSYPNETHRLCRRHRTDSPPQRYKVMPPLLGQPLGLGAGPDSAQQRLCQRHRGPGLDGAKPLRAGPCRRLAGLPGTHSPFRCALSCHHLRPCPVHAARPVYGNLAGCLGRIQAAGHDHVDRTHPVYALVFSVLPSYFLRRHRSEFSRIRHLLVPVICVLLLLPPLYGTIWPVLSFPYNLAPYIVIAWVLIGGYRLMSGRGVISPLACHVAGRITSPEE